jgi:hydroxyacylglutathione hydrolase
MKVRIFPAYEDNYIYLIEDEKGSAILIDPSEARLVLEYIKQQSLTLTAILITHSHADHTGGVETIKTLTGCLVVSAQSGSIGLQDLHVQDGQILDLLFPIRVLSTPGHTLDSVCYYVLPSPGQPGSLFTGDCLFIHGCGRLMGQPSQVFWQSLQKLSALPPETLVYCGHEYTEENCRFALTLEPNNLHLRQRLEEVRRQTKQGLPTVPSSIGLEKTFNPFLRTESESIRRALAMPPEAPGWQVFAELRRRKDRF